MGQENNQITEKGPKKRGPDWKKKVISIISNWLRGYCGKHQFGVLITVTIIFSVFVVAVIYKNFWGDTNIIIELFDKQYVIGYVDSDFLSKVVLSLVEIATLPILILTLMFSAHGNFESSQHDNTVDSKIDALDKGIEKASEDINHNNEDIKQNNKDIKIIRDCLEQFKDEIVDEVKKSNKANISNPPVVEGNNEINEDKNGEINPDK